MLAKKGSSPHLNGSDSQQYLLYEYKYMADHHF